MANFAFAVQRSDGSYANADVPAHSFQPNAGTDATVTLPLIPGWARDPSGDGGAVPFGGIGGLLVTPDGSTAYSIRGVAGGMVKQNIPTPGDLTSIVSIGSTFTMPSAAEVLHAVQFNDDGTVAYGHAGFGNSRNILRWSLSTPYDLTTATYLGSISNGQAPGTFTSGIAVSDDGVHVYLSDEANADDLPIAHWQLTTPWDIAEVGTRAPDDYLDLDALGASEKGDLENVRIVNSSLLVGQSSWSPNVPILSQVIMDPTPWVVSHPNGSLRTGAFFEDTNTLVAGEYQGNIYGASTEKYVPGDFSQGPIATIDSVQLEAYVLASSFGDDSIDVGFRLETAGGTAMASGPGGAYVTVTGVEGIPNGTVTTVTFTELHPDLVDGTVPLGSLVLNFQQTYNANMKSDDGWANLRTAVIKGTYTLALAPTVSTGDGTTLPGWTSGPAVSFAPLLPTESQGTGTSVAWTSGPATSVAPVVPDTNSAGTGTALSWASGPATSVAPVVPPTESVGGGTTLAWSSGPATSVAPVVPDTNSAGDGTSLAVTSGPAVSVAPPVAPSSSVGVGTTLAWSSGPATSVAPVVPPANSVGDGTTVTVTSGPAVSVAPEVGQATSQGSGTFVTWTSGPAVSVAPVVPDTTSAGDGTTLGWSSGPAVSVAPVIGSTSSVGVGTVLAWTSGPAVSLAPVVPDANSVGSGTVVTWLSGPAVSVAPLVGGGAQVWNGSAWVTATVWNGSAWVPLQVGNGVQYV